MKQTAVEWLIEQLEREYNSFPLLNADACIKALEMEKEQIIEFARKYANSDSFYCSGEFDIEKGAEQYYNETFKSE